MSVGLWYAYHFRQQGRIMSKSTLKILPVLMVAITVAWGLSVRPAQAGYIVTLQQVGSNVVANGSGAIDLSGLGFLGTFTGGSAIGPDEPLIDTGTTSIIDEYSGFSGPTSFGSGTITDASSESGDFVGIQGGFLFVPTGYLSGTALSDSSTYTGQTFSTLGVTPGTYEWTWGSGANQNFTLEAGVAAVPDSGSTLGLLFLSLVGLLGVVRFRLA